MSVPLRAAHRRSRPGRMARRAGATVAACVAAACASSTSPEAAPKITSFAAAAGTVVVGSMAVLTWVVESADRVQLEPGLGDVTDRTERSVAIDTTTTFTLIATSEVGADTATATVTAVPPPPVILSFTTQFDSIVPGGYTVIDWGVDDADEVRIDPVPGVVVGRGLGVRLDQTTTYVLSATNDGGTSVDTVRVYVVPPTQVPATPYGFSAVPLSNGGAALYWSPVAGAGQYRLERKGDIEASFSVVATVESDRLSTTDSGLHANSGYAYRLTALNGVGQSIAATASSIGVPAPPEGPDVTIDPASTTIDPAETVQFALAGGGQPSWLVLDGLAGGTISGEGLYRAPAAAGTYGVASAPSQGVGAVAMVIVR